jgi:hypothetical protein
MYWEPTRFGWRCATCDRRRRSIIAEEAGRIVAGGRNDWHWLSMRQAHREWFDLLGVRRPLRSVTAPAQRPTVAAVLLDGARPRTTRLPHCDLRRGQTSPIIKTVTRS